MLAPIEYPTMRQQQRLSSTRHPIPILSAREILVNRRRPRSTYRIPGITDWQHTGARAVPGRAIFCLDWTKNPRRGGERLFIEQKNGLGVGNCLAGIGLAKAFLDLCQEAESFDRILKRGGIRKPLDNLKDLLFHRFNGHDNHLA